MSSGARTTPAVAAGATNDHLAIDADRLAQYMQEHVNGFAGPLRIERFEGGQSNPTYRLTSRDAVHVLRRKPPGKLLPSAHAVDREYRVMTALARAAFPVPRTYVLCTDETVIGTPFYIMDHIDGRVFWDQSLPGVTRGDRAAIYDEMNRVIAALHTIDYDAIGLTDFGRPGNYFARQIDRWTRQYRSSETENIPAMDDLIEWLPHNIPPGEETCVVHGDYRLDNLLFHPTEPRVLAVIDWELSTLGHPLADFAYNCMSWLIRPDIFRGIGGLDLQALGIPDEAEYVRAYCRRTGRSDIAHWDFYIAFNLFRLAAILQGIMARGKEGTAASADALGVGRAARPLAELGRTRLGAS